MSLNISALPGKMKDYALSDDYQLLTKLLVNGLGFTEYMETLSGVTDEIPLTELFINEILQPGAKDSFNAKANAVGFKARIGKVRPCKVDLEFTPTQINALWKSYLGKVSGGKIDVYTFPFEAFIMDKVVQRAKEDLRMKSVFTGVYNASGTGAADTMDGLDTKITADITAGNIPAGNVLTQAAFSQTNAYDLITALANLVVADPRYGMVEMVAICSPIVKRYYELDYQATFGALPYNTGFAKQTIDGTNIEMIAEPALTGSNRVIITPRSNFYWLVDDEGKMDNLIIEYAKRNISVMLDFNAGVDYGIAELIWTNKLP